MNDHLVSLARRPGIDAVMESRLCDEGQRVGLLMLHARRFRGNVLRDVAGFASQVDGERSTLLIQRFPARVQSLNDHDFRRQTPADNPHTVGA